LILKNEKFSDADVIEIGARLTECKRLCKDRGDFWLPWLKREFEWGVDTAEDYINIHKVFRDSDCGPNLNLPIRSLRLLAAPSTPVDARDAVLDLAANGEHLTHEQVKRKLCACGFAGVRVLSARCPERACRGPRCCARSRENPFRQKHWRISRRHAQTRLDPTNATTEPILRRVVTAWNFMKVYELSLKYSNFEDLNIPVSALYLLAAPSTPVDVRDAVLDLICRHPTEAERPGRLDICLTSAPHGA
jgi:hypothetical protein